MFSPRSGRMDKRHATFHGSLMASIQQQYWHHHRAINEASTRRRNEEMSRKKVMPVSTVYTTHIPLAYSPNMDKRRDANYRNSEKFKPSYYLPMIITDGANSGESLKNNLATKDSYTLYEHKMFRPQEQRNCMALSKTILKEKKARKNPKQFVTVLSLRKPSSCSVTYAPRENSTEETESICRPPNTPEQTRKNNEVVEKGLEEKWALPREEARGFMEREDQEERRVVSSLEKRVNFVDEKRPSVSTSEPRGTTQSENLQLPSIDTTVKT